MRRISEGVLKMNHRGNKLRLGADTLLHRVTSKASSNCESCCLCVTVTQSFPVVVTPSSLGPSASLHPNCLEQSSTYFCHIHFVCSRICIHTFSLCFMLYIVWFLLLCSNCIQ